MTEKFVASNTVEVVVENPNRTILKSTGLTNRLGSFDYLSQADMDALREFFLHERDTELGRWRSKEQPNYVVYTTAQADWWRSFNEETGEWNNVAEGLEWYDRPDLTALNREFFIAHPVHKPWHDATPGEVWLFKAKGSATKPSAFTFSAYGDLWINSAGVKLESKYTEDRPYGISHDPDFEPRRIWPESN